MVTCVYAASRLISFRIEQFGTIALIQDAHVNMPFQSWELLPRAANHAHLTVTAAVVEVEIQIKVRLECSILVVLVFAVVERRTRDRKVAGSTPGRSAINSTRSTQPSIPLG